MAIIHLIKNQIIIFLNIGNDILNSKKSLKAIIFITELKHSAFKYFVNSFVKHKYITPNCVIFFF
jgi:hypothetical protein